ncbi:MAG: response regulator [Lachnospiraceae bacterium]|nr:response regulator [Lachnospiraceae bacterium]
MKDQDVTKRTLLIIEDDEINCQILTEILEEKYSVITAQNGKEGLDLLKRYGQHISAIMLDIQMPVMDGYEFLELVGCDAVLCKIPVIVTTVLDNIQDEVRCLELGAADFIVKPYNPKLIMVRVENIIRLRECDCLISELEIDALTGFKNRKAYYQDIEKIENDEVKSGKHVGVAFADINGLKSTNDRSGHEAGDKLISRIAETIAEVFPHANKYRLGGDEFVVLSFEESEEAFREKIRQLESRWKGGCSAAIGSVWLDEARKLEQNVALADKEMYRDKSRYYENKMHDRRRTLNVNTEDILKRVEAVAEFLPGGFFIYRADEKEELITINTELLRLFECETEEEFREFTGNSFKGMVHPDDLKLVESDISDQIKKENDIDRVRYRILCKDGTEKYVIDYGRFVHTEMYGDVYYVFMNDIPQD